MSRLFIFSVLIVTAGFIVSGCSVANLQLPLANDSDFACQTDSDCVPVITDCNSCPDFGLAVNKSAKEKYALKNCNKAVCAAMPRGKAECIKNRCELNPDKWQWQ